MAAAFAYYSTLLAELNALEQRVADLEAIIDQVSLSLQQPGLSRAEIKLTKEILENFKQQLAIRDRMVADHVEFMNLF
jgi:hypothetical protein